ARAVRHTPACGGRPQAARATGNGKERCRLPWGMRLAPPQAALKDWVARAKGVGVTSSMAQDPQTPPVLFDRVLLHARQRRAQAQGPVSFLLERVNEDMVDRLAAVMREFREAADLWTPGEGLSALRARLPSVQRVELDAAGAEKLPFAA